MLRLHFEINNESHETGFGRAMMLLWEHGAGGVLVVEVERRCADRMVRVLRRADGAYRGVERDGDMAGVRRLHDVHS